MAIAPVTGLATVADDAGSAADAVAQALGAPMGSVNWIPSLMVLMPVAGLIGVTLCAMMGVRSKLPAWITVAGLAVAFLAALAAYVQTTAGGDGAQWATWTLFEWIRFEWAPGRELIADFSFYFDSLTCLWMLFVTGLATLIALYASEYMAGDRGPGYCRFFAAFNLFVASMACLVMGDNMLMLFLGWEGVGLCSYLLIGYFYKKDSAVVAAKKAFVMNRIGDFGLALGVMLTFVQFGTIEYAKLFPMVGEYVAMARAGDFSQIPFNVQLIPVLLAVGAFGKSAQLPLYVWLPDAMEGPTPVSALIHAATMVTAGVYLVARFLPMFQASAVALPLVATVGTATALVAATIGMAQFDIKRIMAYSTVSQLGYMFAGLGFLTAAGGVFHVFTHAFFKAALFLCCGAVMHGFAGQLDLRKLSGVMKMPGWSICGVAMLIGCLNLAGFPLTAGYFSKDMILAEAFVAGGWNSVLGWVLILTAGLTAYYTFRVFFRVFVGPEYAEPGDELHDHDDHAHGEEHAHDSGEHGDDHASHFHPHAPGWAINTVLAVLSVAALTAAIAYPMGWVKKTIIPNSTAGVGLVVHDDKGHGGDDSELRQIGESGGLVLTPDGDGDVAHGDEGHGEGAAHGDAHHGTFLGMDPHGGVMYVFSAIVGAIGIGVAWRLHYAGRKTAAEANADKLALTRSQVAHWARGKWFVDEFYNALFVMPLKVFSHIFHTFDKLIVDGLLVNGMGMLPKAFGGSVRPSQTGVLHGHALRMLAGVCVVVLLVLLAPVVAGWITGSGGAH